MAPGRWAVCSGALLAPFAPVRLYTTNAEHARTINRDGLLLAGMDGVARRATVTVLTDPAQSDRPARSCSDLHQGGIHRGRGANGADRCWPQRRPGAHPAKRVGQSGADCPPWSDLRGPPPASPPRPPPLLWAGTGPLTPASGRPCSRAAPRPIRPIRHDSPPWPHCSNRAAIETRIADDGEALLWSKLIVNVGNQRPHRPAADPQRRARPVSLNANGLWARPWPRLWPWPGRLASISRQRISSTRVRQVCALTGGNRSSMLQDILRGSPTEIRRHQWRRGRPRARGSVLPRR